MNVKRVVGKKDKYPNLYGVMGGGVKLRKLQSRGGVVFMTTPKECGKIAKFVKLTEEAGIGDKEAWLRLMRKLGNYQFPGAVDPTPIWDRNACEHIAFRAQGVAQ